MSGKHLNDISKVYLDTIANVKKAETDADIKRWEDLGGPTPGNYRADDNSAKLKEGRRLRKSDWRQDLKEVIDKPETEEKAEKKVDEKKGIKNKIVINPTFKEAIQEIGGELLEVNAVDSLEKTQEDTQKRQEAHKKQIEAKQKKVAAMKKIVLQKKMQAVRGGAGSDITAGYEPEGELIEGKKKGLDGKACWDGYKLAGTKKKGGKTVDNCVKEDELQEKDLNAAERRALPNKDFVFPGKGEGPEGKQRGAYPINDKKHARAALAMAAAHASPEKEAKVKAAVKKKYPEIEVQSEGLGSAVATGVKAAGKWAVRQGIKVGGKAGGKFVKQVGKEVGKEAVKAAGEVAVETGKGVVDAAKKRGRKAGENFATNVGKPKDKKETNESVSTFKLLTTPSSKNPGKGEKIGKTVGGIAGGVAGSAAGSAKGGKVGGIAGGIAGDIAGEKVGGAIGQKFDKKKPVKEGVLQMVKTIGRKKKPEKKAEKAMDAGARARRKLQQKDHETVNFLPMDEAKVDQGRSDYGKATIRNYRRSGPGHGEPAMFDSENKRGKTIDKRREEHKARRGVKGAKVPAYKVDEDYYAGTGEKVAAERKKRQDADNKAYASRAKKAGFKSTQDYTNTVARYGGEDNYKKGRGLGT